MTDIAPLIFRGICRRMSEGGEGSSAAHSAIPAASGDPCEVRKWLVDEVARLGLPNTKVYTDEPGVRPHLVVRHVSENGDFAYLGIDIQTAAARPDGGDPAGLKLDFGSLPPFGMFKTEWANGKHLFVKGYYLFILPSHSAESGGERIDTMVMCDGDFFNDDLSFFLGEERTSRSRDRQGSYGDGSVHKRVNYYFPNSLHTSIRELAHCFTLIHASEAIDSRFTDLVLAHTVKRVRRDGSFARFYLYRYGDTEEAPIQVPEIELFGEPKEREPLPQPRRRFVLRD